MDNASHIQHHLKNPELWRVLFISAALLGIYLSIIIAGFQKFRKQHSLKLTAFLIVISMFLLQLTGFLGEIHYLTGILNSIGAASALLIGPFSLQLNNRENRIWRNWRFYLQLLPFLTAVFLLQVHDSFTFWIYLAGGVSAGIYLVIQVIKLQMGGFWENLQTWMGRFTLIQLGFFVPVAIAGITCPALCCKMIVSICLSILIVVIWIRLMYTAISLYIK